MLPTTAKNSNRNCSIISRISLLFVSNVPLELLYAVPGECLIGWGNNHLKIQRMTFSLDNPMEMHVLSGVTFLKKNKWLESLQQTDCYPLIQPTPMISIILHHVVQARALHDMDGKCTSPFSKHSLNYVTGIQYKGLWCNPQYTLLSPRNYRLYILCHFDSQPPRIDGY